MWASVCCFSWREAVLMARTACTPGMTATYNPNSCCLGVVWVSSCSSLAVMAVLAIHHVGTAAGPNVVQLPSLFFLCMYIRVFAVVLLHCTGLLACIDHPHQRLRAVEVQVHLWRALKSGLLV